MSGWMMWPCQVSAHVHIITDVPSITWTLVWYLGECTMMTMFVPTVATVCNSWWKSSNKLVLWCDMLENCSVRLNTLNLTLAKTAVHCCSWFAQTFLIIQMLKYYPTTTKTKLFQDQFSRTPKYGKRLIKNIDQINCSDTLAGLVKVSNC